MFVVRRDGGERLGETLGDLRRSDVHTAGSTATLWSWFMMSLSNEEHRGGVLWRRRKWDLVADSTPGFIRYVVPDGVADDDKDRAEGDVNGDSIGVSDLEIFLLLMSPSVVVGEEKSEVFRLFQHFDVAEEFIVRRYSYVSRMMWFIKPKDTKPRAFYG
jgi:hypothetical protein